MALALLSAGLPVQAEAKPSERVLVYVVKEGDFLRALARRFYKRTGAWARIYRDNRHVIGANPDRIEPGMRLRLVGVPQPPKVPDPPQLPLVLNPVPEPIPTPEPLPTPEPTPDPLPSPTATPEPVVALPATVVLEPSPLEWSHYLPVASSLVIAGSGQMMQGQWAKGGTHLGLMALSLMAFKTASDQGDRPMQVLSGVGALGITLWSPWDAFVSLSRESASASVGNSSQP